MVIALAVTSISMNLIVQSLKKSLVLTRQRLEERMQAELALRKSEEKFRILFETSRDFLYITDMSGRIIEFNKAASALSGYSPEELRNINIRDLYYDARERDILISKIIERGFVENYEIKGRRKDGTVVDTLVNSTALKDEEGNVVGFQGGIKGITEIKRAEVITAGE